MTIVCAVVHLEQVPMHGDVITDTRIVFAS